TVNLWRAIDVDALPGLGHRDLNVAILRLNQYALDRLGPGVEGEHEGPPVHRHHESAAHVDVCTHTVFGRHVNVRPALALCSDLDQRCVERAVLFTDACESVEVTGVTAVEDFARRPGEHPGRPEGTVPRQAPSREVLGRGSDQGDSVDLDRFIPVELDVARD